jgi:hypothetical protein
MPGIKNIPQTVWVGSLCVLDWLKKHRRWGGDSAILQTSMEKLSHGNSPIPQEYFGSTVSLLILKAEALWLPKFYYYSSGSDVQYY